MNEITQKDFKYTKPQKHVPKNTMNENQEPF
jgi:hypothetical protein